MYAFACLISFIYTDLLIQRIYPVYNKGVATLDSILLSNTRVVK